MHRCDIIRWVGELGVTFCDIGVKIAEKSVK